MGDSRRFDLFADVVARRFLNRAASIADVAGGKGLLRGALHRRGFGRVVTIDRRQRLAKGRPGTRYGLFDGAREPAGFDLVVGMHPDAATDHIIVYAARHGVPFAVCPCCVIPSALPFAGPTSYAGWTRHLARLACGFGFDVEDLELPMRGCATVLVGHPPKVRH